MDMESLAMVFLASDMLTSNSPSSSMVGVGEGCPPLTREFERPVERAGVDVATVRAREFSIFSSSGW